MRKVIMADGSANSGGQDFAKIAVANEPHYRARDFGGERIEPAPRVIERLLDHLESSKYRLIARSESESGSEIEGKNLRRARQNFSEKDAEKLIEFVADQATRQEFRARFHWAELLRRADRLKSGSDDVGAFAINAPRDLLNEVRRSQSQRVGSAADYWAMQLLRLQFSFGADPVAANVATLRDLYERYVADVRVEQGENPAFSNALILLNAYLHTHPFRSAEQRHALLGIAYIAIDLAAQINDYKSLRLIAEQLSAIRPELTWGGEQAILRRLILDALARANRYCPQFDYSARVRRTAGEQALTAIENATSAIDLTGGLAVSWPELTTAWVGSFFGLLNYGINVGWPPDKLELLFKQHDGLVGKIKVLNPGALLLEDARRSGPRDAYMAEFLATLAISRENPLHNLTPGGSSYRRAFDPDAALAGIDAALAAVDPRDHYGDTIVAGLHLVRSEALLCKYGRSLRPSLRGTYEVSRARAAQYFARLGMSRKMLRLDRLELRAGIVR